MISALTQLGLDPWDEAGRLGGLSTGDAVEQLTQLILSLPGQCRAPAEAQQIAVALIDVLPRHKRASGPADAREVGLFEHARGKAFWVICFVLTAVAFAIMIASG